MIRLSLIVATFNRSEQLLTTLLSVAQQSHTAEEWECIVVDNNSKDDTRSVVEKFISEHPTQNFRYKFVEEQGLSFARNGGIREAKGDIVAFIDDDERIVADFVSAYIELFDLHPDAMSAGGEIIAEYPFGRPRWMSRYAEKPIANPMSFGSHIRLFPKGLIPGGGNMAVRRKALDIVGLFDTSLGRTGKSLTGGEESDLFERMAEQEMACYYVPRAVMYHIIPKEKLSLDYFRRLNFNNGRSQLRRAELHHRTPMLYIKECAKWVATLLLCLVHRPAQSRYLLTMRYQISRGIFSRE